MIFNNVEKDALYYAMCDSGAEYAKNQGKDDRAEDTILINDLMENVSRFEFVELIINNLNKKGFKILK